MSERDDIDRQTNQTDRSHEEAREVFPEYATAMALGQAAEETYPHVAAHLRECPTCRAELDELLALVLLTYQGHIAPAEKYPPFDLSFLQPVVAPPVTHSNWFIDDLRRLVVIFTDAMLQSMHTAAALQPTRGLLLYHYTPTPPPPGDLGVVIDIFADDQLSELGSVQVVLDNPALDPFDQSGMNVLLQVDDEVWSSSTNAAGSATIAGVPLKLLSQLRIQIELPAQD